MDGRRLVLEPSARVSAGTLFDLSLDSHYIVRAIYHLPNGKTDTLDFDNSQEQQNEAIECIQCVLEIFNVSSRELTPTQARGKVDTFNGPRRIEAVIRRRKVGGPGTKLDDEKTIVISSVIGSLGPIQFTTLRGRVRFTTGWLDKSVCGFNSNEWLVTRLTEYSGANSSSTSHFGSERQTDVLERIDTFLEKLNHGERQALFAWDPKGQSGGTSHGTGGLYDHPYAGGGYHSHTPYVYKPPVGSYRVAGDEIGAKLCLEQAENLIKAEMYTVPSMQEFLETAEKKAEAEEESLDPNTSSSVDSASGVGGASPRDAKSVGEAGSRNTLGSNHCSYCGQPDCVECEFMYTENMEAVLLLGAGRHTVH